VSISRAIPFTDKSPVFPGPDTGNHGVVSLQDAAVNFFGMHFSLLVDYNYNSDLVRNGAADAWGSRIQYIAWKNQKEQYFLLLKGLCEQAAKSKVWIVLSMACSQDKRDKLQTIMVCQGRPSRNPLPPDPTI
jgi:hypothetical protein